jgi:cellulose synthase (UDP-forming)
VTGFALAKGVWEFAAFGIERDAYFFNMIWAGYNLLVLLGALMVAWERPQRRGEERVRCHLAARIERRDGPPIEVSTWDVSLAGCTLVLDERAQLPEVFDLGLALGNGLRVRCALVSHERLQGRERVGVRFVDPSDEVRRALLLDVFARSEVWEDARAHELRSRLGIAAAFLVGVVGYFRPLRSSRRKHPRRRILARRRLLGSDLRRDVWLRDSSARGIGLLCTGKRPRVDGLWQIANPPGPVLWGRAVYVRRRFAFLWYVGIEAIDQPAGSLGSPEWQVAA